MKQKTGSDVSAENCTVCGKMSRLKNKKCCDGKQCTNILCVQNHMLIGFINDVFAHDREEVINAKDFLEVQARMWKHVRSFYTKDGKLKKKYKGGIIK